MIVVGGGTSAATPAGVETLVSALSYLSPAEWLWLFAFGIAPAFLAGAATYRLLPRLVARWRARRPQEKFARERAEAEARWAGDA